MAPDRMRYLHDTVQHEALDAGRMAFISGPRQVGKSTLGRTLLRDPANEFSWDSARFRRAWVRDPIEAVASRGPGAVLLDEIHKDRRWKTRLKGLYDERGREVPIVVTGSARLDLFRRGGDSLLGRYLPFRLHPFSVGERAAPPGPDALEFGRPSTFPFDALMRLGGFPEPLLGGSEARAARWSRLRTERLLQEDVRDLRQVQDLQALRVMVDLLPERAANLLSVNSLREDVGVAYGTVREWMAALGALYHLFLVRPYAGRIARALRAEPKLYLFDPTGIESDAARRENVTALHLLKACDFWTDAALGEFGLWFARTKEKLEVDFVVTRRRRPWMLVECKSSDRAPSPTLTWFARAFGTTLNFQLVAAPGYDRLHPESGVRVMDYERFLSALV